jgi:pilus assembly protein CpaB
MAERPDLNEALHKAADRKSRRSALRAVLFLALALVAAVGSALLLTRYMEARTAAARVPTEPVVVAVMELPVGTEIRLEHLRAVAWPVSSRPEGVFPEPRALEGKVVSVRMVKGEPVLPAKLAGSEEGRGLAALLEPGTRALAVRVDDVVGVAGFIHPGDRVDVIATLRPEGGSSGMASKVVLQDIKVLAVGKELDSRSRGSEKVVPATVATLMVDAAQSERLALAAAQGKILLTLRGGADREVVVTKGVTPATLLASAVETPAVPPPASRRAARVRPARPEEPARQAEVVEILRGDLFERRDFQQDGKGTKR